MRIDSVKSINGNVHFFPFRSARGSWKAMYPILDSNGGSWLGKEVVMQPNGITVFDNLWGDTVFIHTQANVNESWRFYDDTSSNYYMATITGYDTATISGSLDSLKTLTITAYNSLGVNSADPAHFLQIKLSKHHGFYQTFALYTFPFPVGNHRDYFMDHADAFNMTPRAFVRVALPIFDSTQLFDYQAGDVYQRSGREPFSMGGASVLLYLKTDSIVSKTLLTSAVEYVIHKKEELWGQTNGYSAFSQKLDTVIIKGNSITWFSHTLMPEERGNSQFSYYKSLDSSHCSISPVFTFSNNEIAADGMVNNFEPCGITYRWKIGLGLVDYVACAANAGSHKEEQLLFNRRNTVACGNRSTSVAQITAQEVVVIYPNPVTDDIITIAADDEIESVSVYNSLGIPVMTVRQLSKKIQLNTGELSNGVYTISLTGAKDYFRVRGKFMIIR